MAVGSLCKPRGFIGTLCQTLTPSKGIGAFGGGKGLRKTPEKNCPKSLKYFQSGEWTPAFWSIFGPALVRLLVRLWSGFGPALVRLWSGFWSGFGPALVRLCPCLVRLCFSSVSVHIWALAVFGPSLVRLWSVFCLCLVRLWSVHFCVWSLVWSVSWSAIFCVWSLVWSVFGPSLVHHFFRVWSLVWSVFGVSVFVCLVRLWSGHGRLHLKDLERAFLDYSPDAELGDDLYSTKASGGF